MIAEIKCRCGRITANLGGICRICLVNPINAPTTKKLVKNNKKSKPTESTKPIKDKLTYKCTRCTVPTTNESKLCDICTEIDNHPKKCPRCSGEMELRQGYLGFFWGCVKYPDCEGTITAKGTYMRKFSNPLES